MAHRVAHLPLKAACAARLNNGFEGAGEALRILVNEVSRLGCLRCLNVPAASG